MCCGSVPMIFGGCCNLGGGGSCAIPCCSSSDSTGLCCVGLGTTGCCAKSGCSLASRCAGNSEVPPSPASEACFGPPLAPAIPPDATRYGSDANGNPVWIGPDGTVYDDNGNVLTDLSGVNSFGCLGGDPCVKSVGAQSPSGGGASGSGAGGSGKAPGSGAGGAQQQRRPSQQQTCIARSIGNAMAQFGSNLARMLTGGSTVTARQLTPAQRAQLGLGVQPAQISSGMLLAAVVVFGGLGLVLAFGGKSK